MFSKGSRYRNLSELVFLTAQGDRVRSKVLRIIPSRESNVLHAVKDGDRLDLLAYKYYSDTKKWWQISDANPEWAFPLDLLKTAPLAEEVFAMTHADFEVRYDRLITALENIGEVINNSVNYFELKEPSAQEILEKDFRKEIVEPNYLEERVLVRYPPAQRAAVLAAIQDHDFHLLGAFSFTKGPDLVETFTIDDPEVKRVWDLLVATLGQMPGVVTVKSSLTDKTMGLVYNSDTVTRESLVSLMNAHGFIIETTPVTRVGRKIRIPPNQVV